MLHRSDVGLESDHLGKRFGGDLLHVLEQVSRLEKHALALHAAGEGEDLLHHVRASLGARLEASEQPPRSLVGDAPPACLARD
jgi:hypothetical protein